MDKAIYAAVCKVQGHHIMPMPKPIFEPSTKTTVYEDRLLCSLCGATTFEDVVVRPPRKRKEKINNITGKPENEETGEASLDAVDKQ